MISLIHCPQEPLILLALIQTWRIVLWPSLVGLWRLERGRS